MAELYADKGRHFVTQVTEHKSVLDPVQAPLGCQGCEVTWLGVDAFGRVSAEQVAAAIRPDTVLVSIMWANNETGTIQPITEIGRACKERDVLFHTDATQAVGKVTVDVHAAGVDLLAFSAHKFYGPKGCGGLFVRRKNPRVRLAPLLEGGGHEPRLPLRHAQRARHRRRRGTSALALEDMAAETARVAALRDRLEHAIFGGEPGAAQRRPGPPPAARQQPVVLGRRGRAACSAASMTSP